MKTQVTAALVAAAYGLIALPASSEDAGWKEAVLEQNKAFYDAFHGGDLPAMEEIWGHAEPIILDHPRGDRYDGREDVMSYWQWALPGSSPDISCDVTGVIRTGATVTVYCDELLFEGTLEMKNIFHQEDGEWKMIYHGPPKRQGLS